MSWQKKCLIDSVKALLPFREQLRRLKRHLTGFQLDPAQDRDTLLHGLDQVDWLSSAIDLRQSTILEIGSGWQPMIPVLFSLAGAKKILMTDRQRLCDPVSFADAILSIRAELDLVTSRLPIPREQLEARLALPSAHSLDAMLANFSIEYLAPIDLRRTYIPTGSVDAVTSRAVLEHIPGPIIESILQEVHRILRPGGIMCHIIDNSDHWEHIDKSISRVNFLKFSPMAFRWTHINSLNYQNRLRHSQYALMMEHAGFTAIRVDAPIHQPSRRVLESFAVHPNFRNFSKDDLAILTSYFLCTRT